MTEHIPVPPEISSAYRQLSAARHAIARWKSEETDAKEKILAFLGYDPEDRKPPSCVAVNSDGEPVFQVKTGTRRGLDTQYLKRTYPAIYAECEKLTVVKTIKEPTD